MSKCPIPGCEKGHRNQWEHFNDPKRGVTNEVTTPETVPKRPRKAEITPVTTVTTPVTTQRKSSQKEIDKVKSWRQANRERYNVYMREQRAKKRAAKAEYIKTHLEMMEGLNSIHGIIEIQEV